MSDIDIQSQNFEEVTKTIRRQRDKGSRTGNENFGPTWPMERRSDLSTLYNTKNIYLKKSAHLKLSTCCSKNYPVVLWNTGYHSTPITRILSITLNPNPRKCQVKVYSNHRNFPVTIPESVHLKLSTCCS